MVLNELSLRPLANDVQGARQRMSDLVSTIAAATKLGVGRVLRTHRDFNSEEIAPGYPVAKWRNDHEVDSGSDLWKRREELFPSLQFCETAGEQIQALPSGNPMLRPIMKRLSEFENFCKNWHEGPFDPQEITGRVTLESQVTLERFGQERTFRCPDGNERIFSWHARLTPGAWRVYFYPLEDKRQLIIGYFGSHLQTVSDPT